MINLKAPSGTRIEVTAKDVERVEALDPPDRADRTISA